VSMTLRTPSLFPVDALFPPLTRLPGGEMSDPFALALQSGLMVCSAVATAVQLHLPDVLEEEPLTIEMLAQKTGTHAPSLLLLMRALACLTIFAEVDKQIPTFVHTERSRALRQDAEGGMAALVALWGA